jgi:hypothetical protein
VATSSHTITGNVIKSCEGPAITNGGSNSDIVISGNIIEDTNSVVPGAAIQLSSADRIVLTGNNINETNGNPAIAMLGTSDNWQINQNCFSNVAADPITLNGAGSVLTYNAGYNPVGTIANPWPVNNGDLTNEVIGGGSDPQSAKVYTVRHTPKTIVVNGDTILQININGVDTGLTGGVFKLGVGETIAINYDVAPITAVFAE